MTNGTQHKRNAVLVCLALASIAAALLVFSRKDRTLKVPLGVEQAAIVSFSGPELFVAPYKWGVAVNVRMAEVVEKSDRRIYDVRYFVNREGTFDLRDYLVAADGSALDGLPTFKFRGDAQLSQSLDTRIRETEEMRIDVGGHYDAVLTMLGMLWIGWLFLLIFYKRQPDAVDAEFGPALPTVPELLRSLHARLESGTLNTAGKAQLEMLLVRRWRDELGLGPVPMRAAMDAIKSDETSGPLLHRLQHWLHHPASTAAREEIAAMVESLVKEYEEPVEPVAP